MFEITTLFFLTAPLVLSCMGPFLKDINPVELNEMGVKIEA